MTKESLVSFCWRLIPYWLNSWEQQWGAECSSVMFELPHFALELLVVLPCVQVHHTHQPTAIPLPFGQYACMAWHHGMQHLV